MTVLRAAAYCRVSTDKDAFFMDKVKAEVIRQTEKQNSMNNDVDISKLKSQRVKLINMYENDIIELHELKERLSETDKLIEKININMTVMKK